MIGQGEMVYPLRDDVDTMVENEPIVLPVKARRYASIPYDHDLQGLPHGHKSQIVTHRHKL
jgi:hypothetical protein